jgi:hypothetical protein
MITAEQLNLMEKVAKEQQGEFMAQNPGVQVPRECGIDTLCLINELRERQATDYKQVDKPQLT